MKRSDRILGLSALLLNIIYLVWLVPNLSHVLGWLILAIDGGFTFLISIYLVNHSKQISVTKSKNPPKGSLDIFLPVVNEPMEIFEKTVKAATKITYQNKTIYILDDGQRTEVKELAKKYAVEYQCRGNNIHYKAGNLNFGLQNSRGDFILALDADHVVQPNIVKDLLGFFLKKPHLAIVTTRQKFSVPDYDFNHQYMFYDQMQPGKNSDNAAFSCGSGVLYRRSALETIGGFQTWNVVEDVYTTYILHQNGYQSLYVNRYYATGLAPMDLPTIYKQRGIWALDTLRLFFRKNPFLQKGLSFKQRMHYFETGWAYLFPALAIPVLLLLLPFSIFYEVDLISQEMAYPLLKGPALMMTLFFFWRQSNRRWSEIQFWIALFPVYLKALFLSLLPGKPKYRVTAKTAVNSRFHLGLILPQLCFLALNIFMLYWQILYLDYGMNFSSIMAVIWVGLMLFWFWPLLRKGLGFSETGGRRWEAEITAKDTKK